MSTESKNAPLRYRFAEFELEGATGELRFKGMRVRLHDQPAQVLLRLLQTPGELVTREELCAVLWPDGTFVDFEHGLNSAINRLRDALNDRAAKPRFVETLARRGYRFLAQVEVLEMERKSALPVAVVAPVQVVAEPLPGPVEEAGWSLLAQPEDLPTDASRPLVDGLFLGLQGMYLGFYVGTLANLGEVRQLMSGLPEWCFEAVWLSATLLIAVRVFLLCAVAFRAPGLRERLMKLWPWLLVADLAWSLAPYLLLDHIPVGLATACVVPLVYAPFAARSLVLMGAGQRK
ncbi:MAG: winged helix-turn-helix domain-containing protein [Acidobacteriaceae bacterium]|nr:winged helix-turn-helix domain-containing protein [Acidobacteriaceae bacterium]